MSPRSRPAKVLRFLGSVKLMALLTLAFAISCAVATFIEAASGTPAARVLVYDALWFEILIGLIIVNLSGRGDKDIFTVARAFPQPEWTGFLQREAQRSSEVLKQKGAH